MKFKRNFQCVKDVMKPKVIFIDGMANAKEAIELMRAEKVEALIVKKRNENDAYGIVLVKDLIQGVIIADKDISEVNVFEIMSKPVISVPANMDVKYVANLLVSAGFKSAPVREGNEYIGMVSINDLILDNLFL